MAADVDIVAGGHRQINAEETLQSLLLIVTVEWTATTVNKINTDANHLVAIKNVFRSGLIMMH